MTLKWTKKEGFGGEGQILCFLTTSERCQACNHASLVSLKEKKVAKLHEAGIGMALSFILEMPQ